MERENEHLTTATEDVQLQHVDEKFPNFRLSTLLKTVASGVPELEALLQPTTTVRLPTSFLAGLNAAIADARLTPVRAVAFVSLVNFRLFEGIFPAGCPDARERHENVTARMAGLIRDNLRSMLWEIEWLDEAGTDGLFDDYLCIE
ncbi:hypothetical protein M3Y99_01479800 [Aphelenchoides fujianensis]|nr:hypothetical protein M3Y99_01479800 [Aphelenchoides fujianensis]